MWYRVAGSVVAYVPMIVGLVRALQDTGIEVSLVQASGVRQYARASGILAKTDTIDARVLCAFSRALQPEASRPCSAEQEGRFPRAPFSCPQLILSLGRR
ncbi:MAG TPA: hypothetical protein VK993_01520 [Chthoniobacterales bacterium]|nr:hypothetical protein [Chthoniobacterales bacterium]